MLKEKLDQSDKQLKIQTKVNEEVKRLLVASVGEDIEARVDFLTQVKLIPRLIVSYYTNICTGQSQAGRRCSGV